MGKHTEYLSTFLKTHYSLLTGDGPLRAEQDTRPQAVDADSPAHYRPYSSWLR